MSGLGSYLIALTLSALAAVLSPEPVAAQWQPNGTPLCTARGDQWLPTMVSDGAGGAIVVWNDQRNGRDIYAQRVSGAGIAQWAPDGVPLYSGLNVIAGEPSMVSDGAGGAIVTWYDRRNGNFDVYAQRVN